MMQPNWVCGGLAGAMVFGLALSAAADETNDYPTSARADYVFGCMAVNGQTSDALMRCSCSVDMIASILSYEDYVAAETVLRMRLSTGERAALFRGTATTTEAVAKLRRAQAEAEMLCF